MSMNLKITKFGSEQPAELLKITFEDLPRLAKEVRDTVDLVTAKLEVRAQEIDTLEDDKLKIKPREYGTRLRDAFECARHDVDWFGETLGKTIANLKISTKDVCASLTAAVMMSARENLAARGKEAACNLRALQETYTLTSEKINGMGDTMRSFGDQISQKSALLKITNFCADMISLASYLEETIRDIIELAQIDELQIQAVMPVMQSKAQQAKRSSKKAKASKRKKAH